jgi:hypothetical protein
MTSTGTPTYFDSDLDLVADHLGKVARKACEKIADFRRPRPLRRAGPKPFKRLQAPKFGACRWWAIQGLNL